MGALIKYNTEVNDDVLNAVAHIPTSSIPSVVDTNFFTKLSDQDFMRIAFWLAQKSFDEGGCPIGAVIIDNRTRQIIGKGHNTLVQENHPYNHGETSAIRDAGRHDFSATTLYTTLSPCDVCATLLYMRQFDRVVVGDVTNAKGNEELLRRKGVEVHILEDQACIQLYNRYRREHPDLDLEDWKGLAAVHQRKK
jgi:cytosine/creatinine deaminase